jgi:lipoprotein-anchoring transpeptidase ErfK/SrfK
LERGSSNGCVRMLQGDIDRVFELALEGTAVTIAP